MNGEHDALRRRAWRLAAVVAWLCLARGGFAQNGRGTPDDWLISKAAPPEKEAPPKTISSAEAAPLIGAGPPASTMSQSERKRPPAAEYLIGKVQWGQTVKVHDLDLQDWNLAPRDVSTVMGMAREDGLNYLDSQTRLEEFSFNPRRLPVLLISGVRVFKVHPDIARRLRDYVVEGGMIVCDSVYGSPHFYESVMAVFGGLFPETRFRALPPDHPLYHMLVSVDAVRFAAGSADPRPQFEGLYVGSRVGVLVSRHGLGCGWAGQMDVFAGLKSRGLEPLAYDVDSARALGRNLAAYAVGYGEAAFVEGQPELFGAPDQADPSAEFVFAQLKHDGHWNVHPNAAVALLTRLRDQSTIPAKLRRVALDPARDDLSPYPFLYLTGLDDFVLAPAAVERLRAFVRGGGTLLVNNGLGLSAFHRAALREMARIVPDTPLKPLPTDHELFRALVPIQSVELTPALAVLRGREAGKPELLGLSVGNRLRVIYSPHDLEAGWNEVDYPLMRGYRPASAQELGMNIITYAMTY